MRDEIIRRNTTIIIVAITVFLLLSSIINSYSNRKALESELVSVSKIVDTYIDEAQNEAELYSFVDDFTKNQEWLKISIISNDGTVLKDSSNDAIGSVITYSITQSELNRVNNIIEEERVYVSQDNICYIERINENYILKTSVYIRSYVYILLNSIFFLLIIAIMVVIVTYMFSFKTTQLVNDVFNNISNHLKTINEGEYKPIVTRHRYKEVEEALIEINEINNNIYSSLQKVKHDWQKLEFIINNIKQGFLIIDLYDNVLLINDYALKLFEVESPKKALKKYQDYFTNEKVLKFIKQSINNKENVYFEYDKPEKGEIYSITINCFNNDWQELSKSENIFIINIVNVTQERLEQKNKAEFIANASHELKTLITSISGFSELLLENQESFTEEDRNYLEFINNEALKMKETIDRLLLISNFNNRPEAFEKKENISFRQVVKEVIDTYSIFAKKDNISIITNVENLYIESNTMLIEHLVSNLVENAIKYNKPNGQVIINVKHGTKKIILEVSDTGIGIDEKYYSKIFTRFYRVDESHNSKKSGTGLGLNLVKQICTMVNANISVKSTINVGTTFTVVFDIGEEKNEYNQE